jgi:hypothetical protein
VPGVVLSSAQIMRMLLQSGKPAIVNEVMQLYRFIVDKFSDRALQMPLGSG